jgi:hypothetical protein
MGGGQTKVKPIKNIYAVVRSLQAHKKDFALFGLSEDDVGLLYAFFAQIDVDSSLEITLDELLMFVRCEKTRFTESVFHIFDKNRNRKIDIREFILALWSYLTLNNHRMS